MLELIAVSSVVGILIALLLPAVHNAREAARNQECMQHLRQIGIALHSYHDVHRRLPAGWRVAADGRTAFAWGTALLPYLEQEPLFQSIQTRGSIAVAADSVRGTPTPAVYVCPSDVGDSTFDLFAEGGSHHEPQQAGTTVLATLPRANYQAVFGNSDPDDVPADFGEGPFIGNHGLRFRNLTRGLSGVAFVGERTARKMSSTWLGFDTHGEDAPGRVAGRLQAGPNRPNTDECEFDSRHAGHVNFLFGDGRVQQVADGVDRSVYRAWGRRK